MPNIEAILRQINKDLVPLTLDAHSLEEMDRQHIREEETKRRQERAARVLKLNLDEQKLIEFVHQYREYDREKLIREGLLSAAAPAKGGELITDELRSIE